MKDKSLKSKDRRAAMKMAALFFGVVSNKKTLHHVNTFPNKIIIFNVNVNEIVGKVLKDFKISSQRNTNH